MIFICCFSLLAGLTQGQAIGNQVGASVFPRPRITEVSAMCTAEGITAMVMFDGEFMGRIYSERYGTVHDCIYYNAYDMNMILFSVPNFKCGTRVSRSGQNYIQRIENEVYIQWDKDMQSADDKRYLFICESLGGPFVPANPSFPSPPPRPVNPFPPFPNSGRPDNPNSIIPDFTGTISPEQTIVIQTGRPTEIIGHGQIDGTNPNIYMEIQDGYGPDRPPVTRVVELGETVTLVVGGRIPESNPRFDMRVHSCFATDGAGTARIEIIDRNGCTTRESIAESMQETRRSGIVYSYIPIKAFKFPSSEDVYFTCSVDACSACTFPAPCSQSRTRRFAAANDTDSDEERNKRNVLAENVDTPPMEVYQSMQLRRPVSLLEQNEVRSSVTTTFQLCLSKESLAALVTLVVLTLIAFISMAIFVVRRTHDYSDKGHRSSDKISLPPLKVGSSYF